MILVRGTGRGAPRGAGSEASRGLTENLGKGLRVVAVDEAREFNLWHAKPGGGRPVTGAAAVQRWIASCAATGLLILSPDTGVAQAESPPRPEAAAVSPSHTTNSDLTDTDLADIAEEAHALRDALADAQAELFAAARSDDPGAHLDAAAGLVGGAMQAFRSRLAARLPAESAASIDTWLVDAERAAAAGDGASLAYSRGRAWTAFLEVAAREAIRAAERDSPTEALLWLRLREYRTSTRVHTAADVAADALAARIEGRLGATEAAAAAADDLRSTYDYRLRAAWTELESAVDKHFGVRGSEWAGLARGYFEILEPDIEAKLGAQASGHMLAAWSNLEAAALSGNLGALGKSARRLQTQLADYQATDLDAGAIAERADRLMLFTDLVAVEYQAGVRNGEVVIPIEYSEAKTFLAQAVSIYQELRPAIAASDSGASRRLSELFSQLEVDLESLVDADVVAANTDEAMALIEAHLHVESTGRDSASLEAVRALLTDLEAAVADGDYQAAEAMRLEAYTLFEAGAEARLANGSPRLARAIEGRFWEGSDGSPGLAPLVEGRAELDSVATTIAQLQALLDEAEPFLTSRLTGWLAFLSSAAIIVREGLEAVLIVGAILGYIGAAGERRRYRRWVYGGVAAAIGASLLTWWASEHVIAIAPAQRELIEGIASLIAVAVLVYVTNWLFHKAYTTDWLRFVKGRVEGAMSAGSASVMAALGFTVVYREGFETVLFYQVLAMDADRSALLAGFLAGTSAIAAVAVMLQGVSRRLPLAKLFAATGILLMLLAVGFMGSGVRELQEAGTVPVTWVSWVPENLLLMETLGVYPTAETLGAQAALIALLAATFAISRRRARRDQRGRGADESSATAPSHDAGGGTIR